ncbi:uncharacterized protein LOC126900969 isoform X2 [Daktulosphaira vitifoliae]|uniref:uncharacterized protein LOC126900969 isoform X2 n=1 Tax=Daktulosphaira vitifoliae TaxID=58002 RepID=UPI0021AA4AEF|nr:uncharacterized protein LOC126900969 isoform X2 [Daktulosphaira vitifoliae]
MPTILNTKVYFLYFFVFLKIVATTESKTALINNLLRISKWKNIKDIDFIKMQGRTYELDKIVGIDITSKNYKTQIRCATILLGCSYGNILKIIFKMILYFQNYCITLINEKDENSKTTNCTIELLNTISTSLIPLVNLMKGALDSMDNLHFVPWKCGKRKNYILNKVIIAIQNEKFLNSLNYSSSLLANTNIITDKLKMLSHFFIERCMELNADMKFCQLKNNINYTSFYHKLNYEYNILITNRKEENLNLKFYNFLKIKIESLAQWTIKNRYEDLGFQCDYNTYETFILPHTEQMDPKSNNTSLENLTYTLPHENFEEERNETSLENLTHALPHENYEEESTNTSLENLTHTLPHENFEKDSNKTSLENLAHTLLHENFKEEINRTSWEKLAHTLLHVNYEEESNNTSLENLTHTLPHENFEEERNETSLENLTHSLPHESLEGVDAMKSNLDDNLLVNIPKKMRKFNTYL